jgi:inorganic pyrophosphatase
VLIDSLPQTWEDPTFVHPDAEGCKGDNDPVDVVEIGAKIIATGVSRHESFWLYSMIQALTS